MGWWRSMEISGVAAMGMTGPKKDTFCKLAERAGGL